MITGVVRWRIGMKVDGVGVLGSPHFFCGDNDVFCPALNITKGPIDSVAIVSDVSRLAEFRARCVSRPELS